MPDSITCEDFSLTPAIRERVEENVQYIKDHYGHDCGVSVFLKRTSSDTYKVIFRARVKNKEVSGMEKGDDLYQIMGKARSHVTRMLSEWKEKKVAKRRRAGLNHKAVI